jgi:formiminotetrahydrofolate cyclodeaminase
MTRALREFTNALAARTPAPGGGAAAAAACALGAALAEMAARFAGRDDDAARAARLRAEALRLGEADLTAYAPVLEAQRLAPGDPERPARLASAREAAAEVPLAIADGRCAGCRAGSLARVRRPARTDRRRAGGRRSGRGRRSRGGAAGREQPR